MIDVFLRALRSLLMNQVKVTESCLGTLETTSREIALEIPALKCVRVSLAVSRGDFADVVLTSIATKKLLAKKIVRFC